MKGLLFLRISAVFLLVPILLPAQNLEQFKVVKDSQKRKIDVYVGNQFFTTLIYSDSLEKPVLYPMVSEKGLFITRGFPLNTRPDEPLDHPHHVGLWMNFEKVNGLDFWNNSYAIPGSKKSSYGWIKTDRILEASGGKIGKISYHALWENQQHETLLEEVTSYTFSTKRLNNGRTGRLITRKTVLKAIQKVVFEDAKDGFLGLRVSHELQQPSTQEQTFTDSQGIKTTIRAGMDKIPTGRYLSSTGKSGDSVWGTRATWCALNGKLGTDSIAIVMFDHQKNFNYPTYWHARGYGLFAANPLGEQVFSKGKTSKNLTLQTGQHMVFLYHILLAEGPSTLTPAELDILAAKFSSAN